VAKGGTCIAVASAAASAAASSGASAGAASAASSAASVATCTYTTVVEKILIHNEPHTVTKNIIHRVIEGTSARPTKTSPTGTSALADLETVRLGRSIFASNGLRPLAVVSPFRIIGGHVLLTAVSKNIKLVAATITSRGIEHAVIIDLTKVRDVKAGESLFQTELGEVISGTNPFTKSHDTVSNFTDLLLWNNSNSPAIFSDDDQSTMTVIFR
jgi:hypothetical protein